MKNDFTQSTNYPHILFLGGKARSTLRVESCSSAVRSPHQSHRATKKVEGTFSGCGTVWYVRSLAPQKRHSAVRSPHQSHKFNFRGVAQFGSALGSGPRGRRFESCHSDQSRNIANQSFFSEIGADFLKKFPGRKIH